MTLTASRDERDPAIVKVRCTYGPTTFEVAEHEGHAASFWGQLGRLLAENGHHAETQARAGYERYRVHAAGLSVHGEALPSWDDLSVTKEGTDVQAHWIAAFSG
jgi:hypothetical protein